MSTKKRIKRLEQEIAKIRDLIMGLQVAHPAPAPAPVPASSDDKKGLALLFDKKPVKHYRHTCACGTSVRVNRNPKEKCLKCGQVMATSEVRPRQ